MTDRIFQQQAQGFGSDPCEVVYQINGNTVFSGTVFTVDEPAPSLPQSGLIITNIGWTWSDDVAFSGTKSISIAVSGSSLLLATTLANNPQSNADIYSSFYSIEVDGVTYLDPLTDEAIDGIALSGPYDPSLPGQWWWLIPAGSTFTATMHVNATPPPDPV